MMIRILAILTVVFAALISQAQEKSPWTNESEASIVKVDGNTTSDSYSAKQKSSYKFDLNTFTAAGRYLETKSGRTEIAKQWEASLRYERELSEKWSLFVQHGAESDTYSGYTQRDNTDIGGKYFFIKTDIETFLAEAGIRNQKTMSSISDDVNHSTSGRIYSEYAKKVNDTVSGKFWVEYLPNFKDSDAYLLNYEPSLSVMMNSVFSLKVSYLVKYENKTATPTEKKADTTFTTSLVAKF